MANHRNRPTTNAPKPRAFGLVIVVAVLALGAFLYTLSRKGPSSPVTLSLTNAIGSAPAAALPSIEVNQAIMVTVELDFGGPPPSIAEALNSIERRHQPDVGGGRVFAILDAYGEPTPDGKKLHMSMHISTEKTGVGSLIFKKTGETLWSSRVAKPGFSPNQIFW